MAVSRFRSIMARVVLLAAVAALLGLSGPPRAAAATQIGQAFAPSAVCSTSFTGLQSGAPFGQYAARSAGVITAWSFHAVAPVPQVKFKVGRPTGGDDFRIIGESPAKIPAAGLNTYTDVRIAVRPGDVIGLFRVTSGLCAQTAMGYEVHQIAGDVPPGAAPTFTAVPNVQIDVSARLEADADGDGFGDESQDECPGQAGPSNGCVPTGPSNEFTFGKVKKNKRKGTATLTVEVPAPGTLDLAGKGLKPASRDASAAGEMKLTIKAKGNKKAKLNEAGKAKVNPEVTYTPTGGTPNTQDKKVKLVKK